jgi:hypothetical protein
MSLIAKAVSALAFFFFAALVYVTITRKSTSTLAVEAGDDCQFEVSGPFAEFAEIDEEDQEDEEEEIVDSSWSFKSKDVQCFESDSLQFFECSNY